MSGGQRRTVNGRGRGIVIIKHFSGSIHSVPMPLIQEEPVPNKNLDNQFDNKTDTTSKGTKEIILNFPPLISYQKSSTSPIGRVTKEVYYNLYPPSSIQNKINIMTSSVPKRRFPDASNSFIMEISHRKLINDNDTK